MKNNFIAKTIKPHKPYWVTMVKGKEGWLKNMIGYFPKY